MDETLRLIKAFQFTDKNPVVCPANWTPGQDTIIPDPTEGQQERTVIGLTCCSFLLKRLSWSPCEENKPPVNHARYVFVFIPLFLPKLFPPYARWKYMDSYFMYLARTEFLTQNLSSQIKAESAYLFSKLWSHRSKFISLHKTVQNRKSGMYHFFFPLPRPLPFSDVESALVAFVAAARPLPFPSSDLPPAFFLA